MRIALLGALAALALPACSDYNLYGDEDPDRPGTDTGEPVVDGPQPDIEVAPATISFGARLVGCDADPQTVTVKNVGDRDLDVSAILLEGTGASTMTHDGSPQVVAPGESFDFQVEFTPAAIADYEVNVVVESNDPDEARAFVDAIGSGAETAMNEEIFTQPEVGAVDVLWVVDNSGSMSDIVDHLGDRFSSFLDAFARTEIDYRIGVVSTDMDQDGHKGLLQGPSPWIDSTDPDPINAFVAATDLGSSGSGAEKGMDAAYAALSAPLSDGANAGFLRDDAVLAVVVISDEDDSSDISNSNFINFLNGIHGDPDKSSFSAVVGDYNGSAFGIGCQSSGFPPVTATPGERYVKVQEATGGTFQSICDEDFDEVLTYLGYGASGLKFEFELQRKPLSIGGIRVEVDGTVIPRHPINGWFYDSINNSIRFSRTAVPGPEQVILVTYPVDEDC